jgi:hypothetical protein
MHHSHLGALRRVTLKDEADFKALTHLSLEALAYERQHCLCDDFLFLRKRT